MSNGLFDDPEVIAAIRAEVAQIHERRRAEALCILRGAQTVPGFDYCTPCEADELEDE